MGYIVIDNRANGGGIVEKDTTHCRHCQAVIDKGKWKRDGGIWYCSKCAGPICLFCVGERERTGVACSPWKEKIETQVRINEEIRKRSMG